MRRRAPSAPRSAPHPPESDALVFATSNGTQLDRHNVLRAFRRVVDGAGLDATAWTTRELRHSFVSLLSASCLRIEDISRLVGYSGTAVTEKVYRHQLQAVLNEGTTAMDALFPVDDSETVTHMSNVVDVCGCVGRGSQTVPKP